MESLIATYGYLGIFLGTILEGETTVVVAGVLCHYGFLDLISVIFVALMGSLVGDQVFYYLARWKGYDWACRSHQFRKSYPNASQLLSRHAIWILLASRFLYGLRMVISATCGVMRIPAWRYSLLNLVSALFWTPLMAYLGYAFGYSISAFLNGLYLQVASIGLLLLLALLLWFLSWRAVRSEVIVLRLHHSHLFSPSND
jgi:membrane protein DedA with SNARE-associated domain